MTHQVHIQEPTMKSFVEKVISLTEKGFVFQHGRVIANYLVADFAKEEGVTPTVVTGVTQNSEEKPSKEPVAEVSSKPSVDWDKAEGIGDKGELEAYAREFGIELKKSKSLANMLKDFKKGMADA